VILGWTVLQPSARERRLWLAAVAATATLAVALGAAAIWADPKHPARVWCAALVTAAAAIWATRGARAVPSRRTEVSIARDGALQARRVGIDGTEEAEAPTAVRCVFVAPWLITLRSGAMLVAIWPDSLPSDAFRRLHACARWAAATDAPDADNDKRTGTHDDSAR
jgi:hypothetical protein